MVRGGRLAVVVGLGLLGACTRLVDDPLAVHDVYWGLAPNPTYAGELPRVMFSAPETPAKQGLLYTAMFESEVATQYSGLAAAADDASDMRNALGEVLYAIDPDEAPAWDAKSAGIVSGWAGGGYGVRRAAGEMAASIRNAGDGSATLREVGPAAATCADNTLHRADQIATLSQQALEATAGEPALLQQIHDLARQLHEGSDHGTEPATCGLQQAKRDLDRLAAPGTGG
jgi:hypothetical protein